MRQLQENSRTLIRRGQQQNIRTDDSRRAFLIGGAAAILAGGAGWWVTSRLLQPSQPAVMPVDKHRIFNLPFTGNPPELEYGWLPDSTHIACVTQSEIFLVNVKNGQVTGKQQLPSSSNTLLIHWSTDGSRALIAGKNAAYAQNASSGKKQIVQTVWPSPYQFFPSYMNVNELFVQVPPDATSPVPTTWSARIDFSPDETLVAVAIPDMNNTVEIWNFQEGRRVAECQISQGYVLGGEFDMAWAPDSTLLAVYAGSAWLDGITNTLPLPTLTTWHASDGQLLWTSHIDHPGNNEGERFGWIKWSPDGTTLAYTYTTATTDSTTRLTVLDGQTGTIRFQTPLASVAPVDPEHDEIFVWSPDSTRLALLAFEKGNVVIQIWDAKTGRRLFTCQSAQVQPVNIFWSPDGRYLVATGTNPPSISGAIIQFWDTQTGKALFAYNGPVSPEGLLWSPDSRFVAVNMVTNSNCHPAGWGRGTCSSITYSLQVFQVG